MATYDRLRATASTASTASVIVHKCKPTGTFLLENALISLPPRFLILVVRILKRKALRRRRRSRKESWRARGWLRVLAVHLELHDTKLEPPRPVREPRSVEIDQDRYLVRAPNEWFDAFQDAPLGIEERRVRECREASKRVEEIFRCDVVAQERLLSTFS